MENDDNSLLICRSKSSVGSFSLSRVSMDGLFFSLAGEGGMIDIYNRGEGELVFSVKRINGPYTGKTERYYSRGEDPFIEEIRVFLDSIEGKSVDYPDIEDALYVSTVLFSDERSNKEKRDFY